MVDATAGHELLSFMDAFSRYNQILMHPDDQEKMVFITEKGTYCFKVMPFGLKNVGATYQQLVNKMFAEHLKDTMEVYIDDMLVKSLMAEQRLDHLSQAFTVLKKYNMKLNLAKCSFRVSSGKFLGYMLPVYYVSKSLLDAEARYSQFKKLALALVHASRKLRPYFQCHSIVVLTSFPLKKILHKPELSSRLTQWTVELSEFDISFQPRTTVKSQALADCIADFTPNTTVQAKRELMCMNNRSPSKWTLSVDGSSNMNGNGLGIVLTTPKGDVVQRAIRCGFKCINNEAEYEALIAGLSLAKEIRLRKLEVKSDSQLVVNHLYGIYQARGLKMTTYLNLVKELHNVFKEFSIAQVPRTENTHADALANLGSALQCSSQSSIPLLFLQWLVDWKERPMNEPPEEVMDIELSNTWMTLIVKYLEHNELPADKNEACHLRAKATRFTIYEIQLLRKSFSCPYLKSISPEEAKRVLARTP
ncbi:uncharacterized protein LOC116119120 [Pistacia vera]|uniref:uncharacterized protein LOC116119120 n=1 Tax=Pistacia vera TaxID=55513 RepID=UPI00126355CD|nr:uncharacterized protein LOC116119120 [Pistacia vera]